MIRPKPPTTEEERDLVLRARAGDKEARDRLILAQGGQVTLVARKWARGSNAAFLEDLMQEGFAGVTRALETYDPTRGAKFCTYARFWITAQISIFCGANDPRVPTGNSNVRVVLLALRREGFEAAQAKARQGGRIDQAHFEALVQRATAGDISFDQPLTSKVMQGPGGTATIGDHIPDPAPGPDARYEVRAQAARIGKAMARLPRADREILRASFFEGKTLDHIGVEIGGKNGRVVTRERMRQLRDRALERMRELLAEEAA